jgi:hypothetical protein
VEFGSRPIALSKATHARQEAHFGASTTVVDRRETELIPAFDSGMSWRGIDDVFASGTSAAGAQCRATRAIAMR